MDKLPFALGEKALIRDTGVIGTVEGIYLHRLRPPSIDVKYADANKLITSRYFEVDEISKA